MVRSMIDCRLSPLVKDSPDKPVNIIDIRIAIQVNSDGTIGPKFPDIGLSLLS